MSVEFTYSLFSLFIFFSSYVEYKYFVLSVYLRMSFIYAPWKFNLCGWIQNLCNSTWKDCIHKCGEITNDELNSLWFIARSWSFCIFFYLFISSSLLSFKVLIDLNNGQVIYNAELHFLFASLPVPDLNIWFIYLSRFSKKSLLFYLQLPSNMPFITLCE